MAPNRPAKVRLDSAPRAGLASLHPAVSALVLALCVVAWAPDPVGRLLEVPRRALRYAIATGSAPWLPIGTVSRRGLYPETWIKPFDAGVAMLAVLGIFAAAIATLSRQGEPRTTPAEAAGA